MFNPLVAPLPPPPLPATPYPFKHFASVVRFIVQIAPPPRFFYSKLLNPPLMYVWFYLELLEYSECSNPWESNEDKLAKIRFLVFYCYIYLMNRTTFIRKRFLKRIIFPISGPHTHRSVLILPYGSPKWAPYTSCNCLISVTR